MIKSNIEAEYTAIRNRIDGVSLESKFDIILEKIKLLEQNDIKSNLSKNRREPKLVW